MEYVTGLVDGATYGTDDTSQLRYLNVKGVGYVSIREVIPTLIERGCAPQTL